MKVLLDYDGEEITFPSEFSEDDKSAVREMQQHPGWRLLAGYVDAKRRLADKELHSTVVDHRYWQGRYDAYLDALTLSKKILEKEAHLKRV